MSGASAPDMLRSGRDAAPAGRRNGPGALPAPLRAREAATDGLGQVPDSQAAPPGLAARLCSARPPGEVQTDAGTKAGIAGSFLAPVCCSGLVSRAALFCHTAAWVPGTSATCGTAPWPQDTHYAACDCPQPCLDTAVAVSEI